MTAKRPDKDDRVVTDDEVLDDPLVRHAGVDAVLEFPDGEQIDLNTTPDPFTGEMPVTLGMSSLRPLDDASDDRARARVGRRLQALREDEGLSRKELAERAGVGSARVTQAERGETPFAMSLFTALSRAMGARVSEISAPDAPEKSMRSLVKIAAASGAPRDLVERIAIAVGRRRFAEALNRAFGWARDALYAGAPRSPSYAGVVVFKTRADEVADDAPVLALARTLSALSASVHPATFRGMPQDPRALRDEVLERYGDVSLAALLRWAWDAGIIVLPMTGGRDFTAAAWLVDETPVIVLNESRAFAAYWVFDLAHELGHLARGHVGRSGIVDLESPSQPNLDDDQEREANDFALALLLPDPEALLADVRERTSDDAPRRFKFAVRDVAKEAGVSAGVLGLIAAYEMSDVPADKDRWGSAQNLARDEEPDGRTPVEAAFRERIPLHQLDELDATVLRTAVLSG